MRRTKADVERYISSVQNASPSQKEHFVCVKCEKPFLGHQHYKRRGLAYCETHYNKLFGDVCFHCNRVIEGQVASALNKAWCVNCFVCTTCNSKLTLKDKFVDIDLKPVCNRCRIPTGFGKKWRSMEFDLSNFLGLSLKLRLKGTVCRIVAKTGFAIIKLVAKTGTAITQLVANTQNDNINIS